MKKLVSLLLTLTLLLAACVPMALAEGNEHGDLWIGNYTLKVWIDLDSDVAQYYNDFNETPFYQWLEKETGVHCEFEYWNNEQYSAQMNLMLASGQIADVMYYPEYPDGPEQGVIDGIYTDLNQYKDFMPNYYSCVDCSDGSFSDWEWGDEKATYWYGAQESFLDTTLTVNGYMWCADEIWTDSTGVFSGPVIRKDWLDKLGLEVPKTIDELETVLAAFKTLGDDVIPMSMNNTGFDIITYWMENAYNFEFGWYSVDNGLVQPGKGCGTLGLKDYLAKMADWYQKGYIDPDFMNRDDAGVEALLLSDRLGIMTPNWSSNGPLDLMALYSGEQDFELAAVPMVIREEGQKLHIRGGDDSYPVNMGCIYAGADEETKKVATQWIDKWYSKELILRAHYGIEGETYVLDEQGHPYYTKYFYENRDAKSLDMNYLYLHNKFGYWSTRAHTLAYLLSADEVANMTEEEVLEYQKHGSNKYAEYLDVWASTEYTDRSGVIGFVTFTGDGWDEASTPYNDAGTTFDPYVLRVITGEDSLDRYEDVCRQCWALGFDTSRKLMQQAYNQQHKLDSDFGMDYVMEIDR